MMTPARHARSSRPAPSARLTPPPPAARDRILAAALHEFADRGFDGATTAEIARGAGVTQPLVHYHFASKEALWKAAVDDVFGRLAQVFAGAFDELTDVDTAHRLKVLLRRFVRFCAECPELSGLMAREGVRSGPRLEWLADTHVRPLFEGMSAAFEIGKVEGVVKALPAQYLMFIFLGASAHLFVANGMARELHGIDPTDPKTVETHTNVLIEVLFHGLLQREPGPAA